MRRVAAACAVALLALATGCAPSLPASYHCSSDAQCSFGGAQGHCEANAACSFPDATCAGGQRYGQFSPPGLAGVCVDASDGGAGGGGGGAGGGGGGGGGPTHITRVGSVGISRAMRSSLMLTPVAGATTGDFVLACVLVSTASVTVATPAGWTVHQDLSDSLTGNYRAVYFEHVTAAADPLSWTFTLSGTAAVAAVAVAYRSVDATAPIDTASNATFAGAAFVAPSVTTTHANDYLVTMFVQAQNMTLAWQAPAGMQSASTAGDIAFFDVEQPTPGPSGDKTASFTIGAIPGIGAVDFVALTPK